MKLYFDDESLDGQLQRSVGKGNSGMANVGECLAIAELITPGDRDSWYRTWSGFGDRLVEQARSTLTAGHRVSARGSLLRAAEYFRQAFFFHRDNLDGDELRSAYASSVNAFRDALPLMDHHAEVLSDGLSGYFFAPSDAGGPRPTILHIGGYDGTAEELFDAVAPAIERGFAFAAADGPGQGSMLYDQRVPMRPDWEAVVPGMVDRLIEHPGVDGNRIVLVGRSFGGLIAPRGASGEPRLAAMVVDPGQFEMGSAHEPAGGTRPASRRSCGRPPVRIPPYDSGPSGFLGSADGHPWADRRPSVLPGAAPVHKRRHRSEHHLPELRDGQRDGHGLGRSGPGAL
jgi:hypothetical protein